MRYIKQFWIILLISFVSELCNLLIPLPVPAAVYGLVLMLLALQLKLIRLQQVEEVGGFLLDIMPLIFIPFAVRMLPIWTEAQSVLIPLLVISFAGSILVMIVTGLATQWMVRRKEEAAHE